MRISSTALVHKNDAAVFPGVDEGAGRVDDLPTEVNSRDELPPQMDQGLSLAVGREAPDLDQAGPRLHATRLSSEHACRADGFG